MTLICWTIVAISAFGFGFRLGIAWRDVEAELAEQQRDVAECRLRRKRIEWPANWGEG